MDRRSGQTRGLREDFYNISGGLVARGYIHFVFIIFILESMLLQVVQVVLLLVVLLLVGFGDAVTARKLRFT